MNRTRVEARPAYQWAAALALSLLMVGSAFVPGAQAQTNVSLQAQIAALLAQINALQAQLGGQEGVSVSGACPYTWMRTLTVGASGQDVLRLQQFLNSDPETRVAAVGVGSQGMESQYYGLLTATAVSKFQVKYRSEVLSPSGLVNPTGTFGPASRAKANQLCASAPVVPPAVPPADTDDSEDDDTDTLKGAEAILKGFKISSGDDTNLEEGQRDVQIMDIEFDVEDGDIRISRVDVAFEHVLGDEDDPWDTFDQVSLWMGGDRIARMDTDNRRTWSEDQPYGGAHRVRFSGLDIVVREGDTAEFAVGVTLVNSIDGADTGLSWDVFIPDDGIRARDNEGVNHQIGAENDTVNIDINEEGSDDELAIRSSSDDPDATTLPVEDNGRSDWLTVFVFDLDTDDSVNDITINELPVSFTVSSGTVGTFLDDVRLVIDREEYDDVTITNNSSDTNYMVFDFDRDEFAIDAGERISVAVQARFKALAAAYEGVTIRGSASSTSIDAEGSDDLTANQLSGSATGETHTLRTQGVILGSGDTGTRTQGQNDTVGIFTIEFDVTAFEDDFYIAEYATTSNDISNGGVMFTVEGASGFGGTASAVLASTAEEDQSGVFTVREGETETFTLSVTIDPDAVGQYRVALNNLYFSGSPNGTMNIQTHAIVPQSEYRTAYQNINN